MPTNCVWVSLIIYTSILRLIYMKLSRSHLYDVVATLRFNFLTNHEVFYYLCNSAYTKMGYWVVELWCGVPTTHIHIWIAAVVDTTAAAALSPYLEPVWAPPRRHAKSFNFYWLLLIFKISISLFQYIYYIIYLYVICIVIYKYIYALYVTQPKSAQISRMSSKDIFCTLIWSTYTIIRAYDHYIIVFFERTLFRTKNAIFHLDIVK